MMAVSLVLERSNRMLVGRDSSVGTATGYGLDGPGSNPGGGEIFRTCPDRLLGLIQPPVHRVPGLSRG
jgi:hypothetical protein